MPLAMAGIGEIRIVANFQGSDEMKRHLQDLGFVRGEKVRVVGENSGGLIIMVKGTKLALNRALAQKIIVQ